MDKPNELENKESLVYSHKAFFISSRSIHFENDENSGYVYQEAI